MQTRTHQMLIKVINKLPEHRIIHFSCGLRMSLLPMFYKISHNACAMRAYVHFDYERLLTQNKIYITNDYATTSSY